MPCKKSSRLPAGRSKAMLLPMGRDQASDLILRTRLFLERALRGDIDRGVINHLAQVCILSGYVARAGYGRLPPEHFDVVKKALAQALIDFDGTRVWSGFSHELLAALTAVVNEYDRMLGSVRLELLAKASDYLDRLLGAATTADANQVLRAAGLTASHEGTARTTLGAPA
jgi:hypothetical protein